MKKTARLIALSAIATAAFVVGPSAASATPVASPGALTFSNQAVGTTSGPQNIFLASPCTTVQPSPPACLSFGGDFLAVDIKITGSADFKTTRTNAQCGGAPPISTPGLETPADSPCIIPITFTPSGPGTQTATMTFGSTNGCTPPAGGLCAVSVPPVATNSVTLTGTSPAAKKKCKKGKKSSASAAKKCKKKKK